MMDQDQDRDRAPRVFHDNDEDALRRAAERDAGELQPDLELTEGPASRGRIASYAAVIVLILAAVFYGLHNANRHTASNPPPLAQTSQSEPPSQGPSHTALNTEPGVTTGSATNRPTPPQSGATGAEMGRAKQTTGQGD
jgi:hypothetical protein